MRPRAIVPESPFYLSISAFAYCSVCSFVAALYALDPLSTTPRKHGEAVNFLRSAVAVLDAAVTAAAIPAGQTPNASETGSGAAALSTADRVTALKQTLGGVLSSLGTSLLALGKEGTPSGAVEPTDAGEEGRKGPQRGQDVGRSSSNGSKGSETVSSTCSNAGRETNSSDVGDRTAAAATAAGESEAEAVRVLERALSILRGGGTSAAAVAMAGQDRSDGGVSAETVKVRKKAACVFHISCACGDGAHTYCGSRVARHSFQFTR